MDTAPSAVPSASGKKPKSRRGLLILGSVIAVGLIAGGIYYAVTRNLESTDDAQLDGHVVTVSARVAGTIETVSFVDNQKVTKGQMLVTIDPADYQVKVDAAKAQYAAATATLQAAEARLAETQVTSRAVLTQSTAEAARSQSAIGGSQAAITQAEAAVAAAKARLADAQLNEKRVKSLAGEGVMPQQRLDEAETQLATAQASYEQAEAALIQMQSGVSQAQAGYEAAQGRVLQAKTGSDVVAQAEAQMQSAQAAADAAKANLDGAELQLSYCKVTAPTDGVIAKRTVEPGQTVSPGQPMFSIVPTQDIWVEANFKETQIGRMKPGEAAEIQIDAFSGHTLHGRIESISPATGARFSLLPPDNATGNYVKVVQRVPVRIRFDEDQGLPLRPGLSADVTVDVGSDIKVPSSQPVSARE